MIRKKRRARPWRVAIIGGGNVGSTLGRRLAEQGDEISCVISRTRESARRAARFTGAKTSGTDLAAIPAETDLVFIATPHGAVAETAGRLSELGHLRFKKLLACHASGMLTASVLEVLDKKGTTVFSFHPIQTFPRTFRPREILGSIDGIYYGVDGDAKGIRASRALARKLGGFIVTIPPGRREYYHAACVVASNHLTGLLAVLEEMSGTIGIPRENYFGVFLPIIASTLKNIASAGPAGALSGPVARGGVDTVRRHCESVKLLSPDLLEYFGRMTLETARLAGRKGSITEERVREFAELIALFYSTDRENR